MANTVSNQQTSQNPGFSSTTESATHPASVTPAEQIASEPTELERTLARPGPLDKFQPSGLQNVFAQAQEAKNVVESTKISEENQVLFDYQPTGAGEKTALQLPGYNPKNPNRPTGTAASEALATEDVNAIDTHRSEIEQVAKEYDLPPALLAGLISRESRGGQILDKKGWGDRGNAFGVMQVDKNYHTPKGNNPWGLDHLRQGAKILADNVKHIQAPGKSKNGHHPDWPSERQLQGAVAGYNMGMDEVETLGGIDIGTSHNDYSNDVWSRAQFFAERWAPSQEETSTGNLFFVESPFGANGTAML
jgi:soluble lytic murein transglycosylase-like protein